MGILINLVSCGFFALNAILLVRGFCTRERVRARRRKKKWNCFHMQQSTVRGNYCAVWIYRTPAKPERGRHLFTFDCMRNCIITHIDMHPYAVPRPLCVISAVSADAFFSCSSSMEVHRKKKKCWQNKPIPSVCVRACSRVCLCVCVFTCSTTEPFSVKKL